jgi:glycosyltransferase involved in cell wall biosynthesis
MIVTPAMKKREKKKEKEKAVGKKPVALAVTGTGAHRGHYEINKRIEEVKNRSAAERDRSKRNSKKMENPDVDIVIPLSGTIFLPHLINCLSSIKKQTLPWEDMGIIISCVLNEEYNKEALCRLAMNYEATLVFTKPRYVTFSRGFALNVGARHGSRQLIAFIDADVVLHRSTMKQAVAQCVSGAVMAVIPVVRTKCDPSHKVWTNGDLDDDEFWKKYTGRLPFAKGGYGNSVVNRKVFEEIHGHDERFYGWGGIDHLDAASPVV